MHIGVIGSRSFDNYNILSGYIMSKLKLENISRIVSGGASGTDSLAEQFAVNNNIPTMIFYADWNKYGKTAGFKRNYDIIENSNIIFAFWDGKSRGTRHSIRLAKRYEKKLYIYNFISDVEMTFFDDIDNSIFDL